MPLVLADRVRDTTTTTGTGTVTLSGTAPSGYQNFSVVGNGNTTYYTINAGSQWEVGIGTYSSTGPTLARTTVLASSNSGSLVDFSAGTKDVFVTYPADKSVNYDESNNVGIGTTTPSQKLDVNGSINAGTTNGVALFMANSSAIRNTATAGNTMFFDSGVGTGSTTGDFQFRSTASFTTRMYINGATGSVGVGTTSPARLFEVLATGTNIPARLGNSQGNLDIGGSDGVVVNIDTRSWAMGLQTGGTERIRITTAGLVGIGTASPTDLLDVNAAAATTGYNDFVAFRQVNGTGTHSRILFGQNATNNMFIEVANQANTKGNLLLQPFGGNVGVGTGSPTFNLDVTGTGRFTGLTQFDNDITLNKATLNYLYFNDALAFARNGVGERMRIDTSGNVGIGTSAPSMKLDVYGGSLGTTAGNTLDITDVRGATGNNTRLVTRLVRGSNGSDWTTAALRLQAVVDVTNVGYIDMIPAGATLGLAFGTGGGGTPVERMRIDSAGNVGIGTNSPSSRLTVQGDELIIPAAGWTSGQAARLYLGDTNNGIQSVNGAYQNYFAFNGHSWLISGSERMRIDSSGNVGIATSSPATPLDVGGTIRISTGGSDPGTGTALYFVGSGAFQSVVAGAAFAVHTGNNNARTERMRIDINGLVGIGTSSPGAKLDVTTASGANIVVSRSSAAGYAAFQRIAPAGQQVYDFYTINNTEAGRITVDGSNFMAFSTGSSATERMRIDGSGNVGIGTSSPGYRLDVSGVINTNAAVRMTPTNVGAFTRAQLQSAYNLDGTGASVFTWNYTNGGGELDLFINRNGGGTGGLKIYDFPNTSGNPTNIFTVEGGGNVGIGTASPATSLSVVTNTTSHVGMRVTNNSTTQFAGSGLQMLGPSAAGTQGGAAIYYYNTTVGGTQGGMAMAQLANDGNFQRNLAYYNFNDQTWAFLTNGSERLNITSAGNVGIGTSNPAGRLDVVSTSAGGASFMRVANGSGVANSYAAISLDPGNNGFNTRDAQIRAINNGSNQISLTFLTANAGTPFEAMRIDNVGNVGIGTSSPSQRLTVQGAELIIPAAGWSSGQTAYLYLGDTNNGITSTNGSYQSYNAFNGHSWNVNASEAMRIDGSRNVGIGTSSPGDRLDVAGGNIRIANNYNLLFRNTAGTATARFLVQNDDNFVVYNASGTPISSFTQGSTNIAVYGSNGSNRMTVDSVNNVTHWAVNGSERMRIDGFGSVLIGTTSGGRTVCINAADNWMRMSNPSRSWLIGPSIGSNFNIWDESGGYNVANFDTAGTFNLRNSIEMGSGVNLDNKIQIGAGRTGNNFAYIDLIGDTTYTDYGLRLIRGNGGPNATSQLVHRGTGDMYISTQDAATLYFQTNGTTRAYFQTDGTMVMNGALLVGRNTVGSNVNTNNDTGSFSVRGDGSNAASMSFHRTGAFAINMGLGTDAVFRIGGWSASSNCFQMDASGNLTMLGNVTAYSDARIKKDVETIGSALDLVSKMRGVRYTRIDSGKRGVGVIAQEMLEVLPEVVQQGVGDDDTLSVAYGNLVGVLIEAIKELRAEVAELKGK